MEATTIMTVQVTHAAAAGQATTTTPGAQEYVALCGRKAWGWAFGAGGQAVTCKRCLAKQA